MAVAKQGQSGSSGALTISLLADMLECDFTASTL